MSQYRPGKLLGKGSQGSVFNAQHVISKIDYAVKIVSKVAIKNFHRNDDLGFQEIERLREVTFTRCRSVIGLIQSFEDEQYFYIITEFVKGG